MLDDRATHLCYRLVLVVPNSPTRTISSLHLLTCMSTDTPDKRRTACGLMSDRVPFWQSRSNSADSPLQVDIQVLSKYVQALRAELVGWSIVCSCRRAILAQPLAQGSSGTFAAWPLS